MRIEAVIFDMDGLMLDTETLAMPVWMQAAADCGFEMTRELFLQLVGRTRMDSDRLLSEAFGASFSIEQFRNCCSTRWRVAAAAGIPQKRGLVRLLDALEARAIPKAVATSTVHEAALHSLRSAGLESRFAHLVTGDQIVNGKPAPDIFLEAAARLELPAERCLVLEDSHAGIRAAHAAGCVPVMVPDLLPPTEEIERLAFRVLDSLDDVAHLVETEELRFASHDSGTRVG